MCKYIKFEREGGSPEFLLTGIVWQVYILYKFSAFLSGKIKIETCPKIYKCLKVKRKVI